LSKVIRVLIIDDHPAMAAGLKHILEQEPSIQVVGLASSGNEGIELAYTLRPSIVILDLSLPDRSGIQVCSRIKEKHPATHIIIHTGYDYEPYFNLLLESGVSGMLNKSASSQEVIKLIHTVIGGSTIIPLQLFRQMQLMRSDEVKHYWETDLTLTEQKIVSLLVHKATNADIAAAINTSESSVEKYLKKIYDKLGVRTKNEAITKIKKENRFRLLSE